MVKLTGTRTDSDPQPVLVNDLGHVYTVMEGTESAANSTTTPLAANAVFTGSSIDTFDYAAVTIVVHTDQRSAIEGLEVQYSANGTDWHEGEVYDVLANTTKFFTPTLQARYLRVIYTNGPKPQTSFHLHTTLRRAAIKWSSHNISSTIRGEDDATLTRSVITAKKADGTYDNVSLTNQGNLNVSLDVKSKELLYRIVQRLERIEVHLAEVSGLDIDDHDMIENKK
jgi:hypothetical protein